MPQTINIPPAVPATINPPGGTFDFYVTANTTVCFGTATPKGSFPGLEGKTFEWDAGATETYPIPAVAGAQIPYNTSAPGTACVPLGPDQNGKVIIVGQGPKDTRKKSKPKPKKTTVKKAASKKGGSKAAAKRKAAPKKAAKKSKAKPKAKPKTKAKSKARPKAKSKAKKTTKKH